MINENINVNRTVGWFTSMFPVIILTRSDTFDENIDFIKESMRKIPNKGIGYGIIKYLLSDEKILGKQTRLKPEILFNYLGHFNNQDYNNMFELYDINMGEV
ncbi:condensation domain-containing protein [Paenibacillus gorillae]|uniref:condensation domain-containing protein n=1 Tax=Paenibacillus gorillae TaxID=1243662 RepID=UPI0004B1CE71|nr:condensation domain-containing protein [Paenibacillus gorillae]